MGNYPFPQADNLELVYQIFADLNDEGLNNHLFSEKYHMHERQGGYYLNALCFIGLAEKNGTFTFLSERGKNIQKLDEPFRRKVFQLAILEDHFICDTYQLCKGKSKQDQIEIVEILIEGTFGITKDKMKHRRAQTLTSWYKWFEQQDFYIEEKYNG